MVKLQVIGAGRMGQALIGGLLGAGWAEADEIVFVEPNVATEAHVIETYGVQSLDAPAAGVDTLVAVKPQYVVPVCENLERPTRILSIAAGITIEAIETAMIAEAPVIRVMPNTPALVGAAAAGVAGGTHAGDDDVAWAVGILDAVGDAVVVPEHLLDAVTGLCGSGPAYVFLMAEALTDAGVAMGLTRADADALARQTIYGAGKLMVESDSSPVDLRAGVTTPAGTTAAGLGALEEAGFRVAMAKAVRAATERSIELGKS